MHSMSNWSYELYKKKNTSVHKRSKVFILWCTSGTVDAFHVLSLTS